MRLRRTIFTGFISIVFALALAAPASAAVTIVPDCALRQGREAPQLNCVLQTFSNISQLILGITGSLALLFFVYGGFLMLAAGGNEEMITKGKTVLRNAAIGILIVLLSGTVLRYGLGQLLEKEPEVRIVGEPCDGGVGTAALNEKGEVICAKNLLPGQQ